MKILPLFFLLLFVSTALALTPQEKEALQEVKAYNFTICPEVSLEEGINRTLQNPKWTVEWTCGDKFFFDNTVCAPKDKFYEVMVTGSVRLGNENKQVKVKYRQGLREHLLSVSMEMKSEIKQYPAAYQFIADEDFPGWYIENVENSELYGPYKKLLTEKFCGFPVYEKAAHKVADLTFQLFLLENDAEKSNDEKESKDSVTQCFRLLNRMYFGNVGYRDSVFSCFNDGNERDELRMRLDYEENEWFLSELGEYGSRYVDSLLHLNKSPMMETYWEKEELRSKRSAITTSFSLYINYQSSYVAGTETTKIGSWRMIGFSAGDDEWVSRREIPNGMEITSKVDIGKCPAGSKWRIVSFVEDESGCVHFTCGFADKKCNEINSVFMRLCN